MMTMTVFLISMKETEMLMEIPFLEALTLTQTETDVLTLWKVMAPTS